MQVGLSAIALVMLASVGAAGAQQPEQEALLERGRYLVETAAVCGACHNTFGPGMVPVDGMAHAGGRIFEERGFRAVAPNITQDRETGIGRWSDAEIGNAIRTGRRPDGSLIGPPMPVESYRGISDRDLAAIVAYLRTVKPVQHAVTERSRYPFTLQPHGAPVTSVPEPANDAVSRGAYLAINIVHCMDCHSGHISEGHRDPNRAGAAGLVFEGPWGVAVARNISAHPELGLAKWSDDDILRSFTRGVAADGRRLAPRWARARQSGRR